MKQRTRSELKRRVRAALEGAFVVAAAALGAALFLGLLWLFCVITPDQCSAECEWQRAEMEAAGHSADNPAGR